MIPTAIALPTRFDVGTPGVAPPGSPPLEMVHWPLYSAAAIGNAGDTYPTTVELFNYTRGQNVSGQGTGVMQATPMHTNMDVPRTMAQPRIALLFGVRIVVPPLAITTVPALSDPTVGTTEENNDQADELALLSQVYSLNFKIGSKIYIDEAPIWLMPSNVGIGGLAAASVHANASVVWQTRVAIHTAGRGYSFSQAKVPLLWPGQTFEFKLLCQWTTNPTILDNRLIYGIFDSIVGREIQ